MKQHIIIFLLASLGLLLFVSLGNWQLSRSVEKQALLAEFEARDNQSPTLVDSIHEMTSLPMYSRIEIQGKWLPDQTILLDNQHRDSQVGLWVFTPFQVGSHVIMIHRGFVPLMTNRMINTEDVRKIRRLKALKKPDGNIASHNPTTELTTLTIRKWTLPRAAVSYEPVIDELQGLPLWSNFSDQALEKNWESANETQLQSSFIGVLANDNNNSFGVNLTPSNPDFGPNKHIAYAIQWFSFALIIVILLIAYCYRIFRQLKSHSA